MLKWAYLLFSIRMAFCGCGTDKRINGFEKYRSSYKVRKIATLPAEVNESSGLARSDKAGRFWTHNDSGGASEVYEVDTLGALFRTKTLNQLPNTDWEELADSPDGRLFIGDFGNNRSQRRDLAVYVVNAQDSVQKIAFSYADQPGFPPSADRMNYDCEAFFYDNDSLYLFSKNWSRTHQFVRRYALPATPGTYSTAPQDSIWINSPVTAADISPDGQTFALLTYSKILLFRRENGGSVSFSQPKGCIKFYRKQAEAILFLNNTDLLVTNEQGTMYVLKARKRQRPY
jgi:hypothetical protein